MEKFEKSKEQLLKEKLVERLESVHFDGNGCGTHGNTACSNCYGPSPLSSFEIVEEIFDTIKEHVKETETELKNLKDSLNNGTASDGHHTFKELYEYRLLYNAYTANSWAREGINSVVKSYRHSDGEKCFGGTYFIVVAQLPEGQVSNHYKKEYWNLFKDVPEVEMSPEYDGHTPYIAAKRLRENLENLPY